MEEYRNIYKITASSLEKYLSFNDWVRNYNFPNKNMMVFYKKEKVLAIPASETFLDFYRNLVELLKQLANYENKSIDGIIKEINTCYHDWLEFRIVSNISNEGELPLGYAANCIEGLKDLILYSACAEQYNAPICLRATNNAKEILDNFKLAQTEKGSFIINIDIKVVDEENEQETFEFCDVDASVEHKVVQRIGRAIKQIDAVTANQENIDTIISNAYETGITANMCDALLKLKPESADVEIDTKIRYASAITKGVDSIDEIKIKNHHFYVLHEISKRYKQNEDIRDIVLDGYIKTLKKDKVVAHKYKREIVLLTLFGEKLRTVKAELSEEDYKAACDAHRDEKRVEIRGVLDMSKKTWLFKNVSHFKIIEEKKK